MHFFVQPILKRQKTTIWIVAIFGGLSWATPAQAQIVTFDELDVWTNTGPNGSYYNGDSGIGTNTNGWFSGGVFFGNSFNESFGGFWNGFAYSNVNDTTTPGFTNQYGAITGTGFGGGGNYAVAYAGSHLFFDLPEPSMVSSIQVTNTTYAAFSILNGDSFSKKFGGETGNDPDFFSVVFSGYDDFGGTGNLLGDVEFFLADYRFNDNSLNYIVDQWTEVDLSSLGFVRSISLSFSSSDVGPFGINTPTYVALDQIRFTPIPEPQTAILLWMFSLGVLAIRRRGSGSLKFEV